MITVPAPLFVYILEMKSLILYQLEAQHHRLVWELVKSFKRYEFIIISRRYVKGRVYNYFLFPFFFYKASNPTCLAIDVCKI
jgi:hypothetical protein